MYQDHITCKTEGFPNADWAGSLSIIFYIGKVQRVVVVLALMLNLRIER